MASIQLILFASLRETVGFDKKIMLLESGYTVKNLLENLCDESVAFKDYYKNLPLLIAVNQTMVNLKHSLNDGDEVALFPPVTGG